MAGVGTVDELQRLAAGTSRLRGAAPFPGLAQQLSQALDADEVRITESLGRYRVITRAVLARGTPVPDFEYDLAGTPCGEVVAGAIVSYQSGLAARFPGAVGDYDGYFGVPLAGAQGSVLGHLCAFTRGPLLPTSLQRSFCDVIAQCAVAELEGRRAESQLRSQVRYLHEEIRAIHDPDTIVGASASFARALDSARRVAPTDAAVLITGEPGTGKELVARAIHAGSRRATQSFVKLDCAALSPGALDAALFGDGGSPGLWQVAREGTLFLDEVGEMDSALQAKLLSVVQEQELARANGGTARADVRLVAATNRDLRKAVRDGSFREDVYYRLNVFPVELPPLRARIEDIPLLVQHFARRHAARIGRRVDGIDPDTLATLARYPWPGNVRELEGLVVRALILNTAPALKISPELLAVAGSAEHAAVAAAATGVQRAPAFGSDESFDDLEATGLHHVQREHILRVLKSTHWVIEGNSGAALKLGMKPATLRHRMKKLGIVRAGSLQT